MTKLRVHELAKELNISNNEIKAILGKNGIEIKSHMSAVDENMINIVKKACGTGTKKADAPAAKPVPEKKPEDVKAAKTAPEKVQKEIPILSRLIIFDRSVVLNPEDKTSIYFDDFITTGENSESEAIVKARLNQLKKTD